MNFVCKKCGFETRDREHFRNHICENIGWVGGVVRVGEITVGDVVLASKALGEKRDGLVYLDREVMTERLNAMPASRDKLFLQTLWMTGIRITEGINLRKRDCDFKNKTLTVRWLKSRKWKDRIIPLRNDLSNLLELYSAGFLMDDVLFPFNRLRGFRISKKWLYINPHAIRHSYAVNYLRQGGRIDDLRQLLGHRFINTTIIYTKLVPKDLKESIEKIVY